MAVSTLHEAALILQGAYQALERLFDETEPLERQHHQKAEALHKAHCSPEVYEHLAVESGWRSYYDVVDALRDLLDGVDAVQTEEALKALP